MTKEKMNGIQLLIASSHLRIPSPLNRRPFELGEDSIFAKSNYIPSLRVRKNCILQRLWSRWRRKMKCDYIFWEFKNVFNQIFSSLSDSIRQGTRLKGLHWCVIVFVIIICKIDNWISMESLQHKLFSRNPSIDNCNCYQMTSEEK